MSKKVILKQSRVCLVLAAVVALTGSNVWAAGVIEKGNGIGLSADGKASTKYAADVSIGTGSAEYGISIGAVKAFRGIAIGSNDTEAKSKSHRAIAIGQGVKALNGAAIVIGVNSSSSELDTIVMGRGITTVGEGAVALGKEVAGGTQALAFGYETKALGLRSIAQGYQSEANGSHGLAIGDLAKSNEEQSLALGNAAQANKALSVAIGSDAKTDANQGVSLGSQATINTTSRDSIAIGTNAYVGEQPNPNLKARSASLVAMDRAATDDTPYIYENDKETNTPGDTTKNSIAMGFEAAAYGFQTTAIGTISQAFDSNSVALGVRATSQGHYSVAIGQQSRTYNDNALAIGHFARGEGEESTALGYSARAKGNNNLALGDYSRVVNEDTPISGSVSVGSYALTTMDNSVALGKQSLAGTSKTFANPAYLSNEAFAASNGIISVGNVAYTYEKTNSDGSTSTESVAPNTRRIINVAGGYDATDAVNVAQLKALEQKIENNMGPQDVTFIVDSNLSVNSQPINNGKAKQVTLGLNKDINLGTDGSVKAGNTTINKNGIITNGGVQITDKGINAGDKVISHVAPGEQPTDAVNVSQLKDLKTNINNDLTTGLQNARNEIGRVESKLNTKIEKTGAMGAALAALNGTYDLDYKKTAINAGLGYYKGESAIALGVAHRVNEDIRVSAGLAYSGNNDTMINAGISWAVGSAPNASVNIREENKELRNRLADQEARLQAQQAEINELKAAMQTILQK